MRMAQLLPIAQLGQTILWDKAQPVEDVHDPAVQALIQDMLLTCHEMNGVGLAAPQVFQPLRIIIVASRPSPRYPNAPIMEPTAIINPAITILSGEVEMGWEGCLSIPGLRGKVPRRRIVKFNCLDLAGKSLTNETLEGFPGRILQHECDHLGGILFTDRTDRKDLVTEREYEKLLAGQ